MTDTAKQLFAQSVPTSLTTVYTVPAATTTVVRGGFVPNKGSETITFELQLGDNPSIYVPIPIEATYDWSGFQVLTAGQTIKIDSSLTGLYATFSGVEIT